MHKCHTIKRSHLAPERGQKFWQIIIPIVVYDHKIEAEVNYQS